MNDFTNSKYKKLQSHFNQLEKVRSKNEALFNGGHLAIRDISQLYRGLFLDGYISFESFLEEIFIGLLQKDKNIGHAANPILPVNSAQKAQWLLFSRNKYLDWIPYSKTEEMSKIYFKKQGNPFTDQNRIEDYDKAFMNKELPIVRNILSHNSIVARKKFNGLLDDEYPFLSPQERRPINFIRHVYRRAPNKTLLEEYLHHMLQIAHKIAE